MQKIKNSSNTNSILKLGTLHLALVMVLLSFSQYVFSAKKRFTESISYTYNIADSKYSANVIASSITKFHLAEAFWKQLSQNHKEQLISHGIDKERAMALVTAYISQSQSDHTKFRVMNERWSASKYSIKYQWVFDSNKVLEFLLQLSAFDEVVGHILYINLITRDMVQNLLDIQDDNAVFKTGEHHEDINLYHDKIKMIGDFAQVERAIFFFQNGLLNQAIKALAQIKGNLVNHSITRYYKAKILLEKEDFENAKRVVQHLISEDPANPSFLILLGYINFKQGNKSKALSLWKKSLSNPSSYSQNLYDLADYFDMMDSPDLSQKALVIGVRINPNPDRLFSLAMMLQDKNPPDAINYLNKAIDIRPNFWKYYATLGEIYFKQNDLDKSIYNYRSALAIDGNNASLMVALASIYLQRENVELALLYYQQAIHLLPDNKNIKKQIEKALKSISEKTK